jgi:hypothetical protein
MGLSGWACQISCMPHASEDRYVCACMCSMLHANCGHAWAQHAGFPMGMRHAPERAEHAQSSNCATCAHGNTCMQNIASCARCDTRSQPQERTPYSNCATCAHGNACTQSIASCARCDTRSQPQERTPRKLRTNVRAHVYLSQRVGKDTPEVVDEGLSGRPRCARSCQVSWSPTRRADVKRSRA